MRVVRPVNFGDIQALEQLAVVAGGSLSTLPANRDHLSELIGATQQALRAEVSQPGEQSYHFVLEERETGEVLGVCGINAAVGLDAPFYSYRVEQLVHASSELQIHNRIPALHLCHDYTGASRLCTLFLAPAHRTDANLQLLSRARMLFMAAHRERFADRTLVELQGMVDANGQSPFWESLGRHFFSMEYARANYLTGIQKKSFIADLMPRYPVYVPLLPPAAQAAIGELRPDVAPVRALLEREGFEYRGYVDIFDAGPTLEASTDRIRSLNTSVTATLETLEEAADGRPGLVAGGALGAFRCLLTPLATGDAHASATLAKALGLSETDPVRFCPLNF
ncbi:arginine N-succinyltransferase [Motiliproteus sp. SC1-56]|uniref:arginine N-succinyltransferase n=1 Tax=Motiliproteus sp. SC1-56 TaxID=2799565 RepID=UPI001A8FB15D|nr:arginine N-succinyltransferase [Motiliproteus sp. SC1-56]